MPHDNTTTNMQLMVEPDQARSCIIKAIMAKKMPILHGEPGIGKSDIVRSIAQDFNLYFIDERLSQADPTDMKGFPDASGARAKFKPFENFPIEGDALPVNPVTGKPYDGWLLFLDEITSAKEDIQAAAYRLVLDKMVGNYHLHSKVVMVAAGNLESDNAIVVPMSTALRSRMVHLVLRMSLKQWINWAIDKQFDHRITDFISFKPANLHSFDPDSADLTYACPRTWFFVQDILAKGCQGNVKDPDFLPLASGCVTEGITREFLIFCDIYASLPKLSDIMMAPMAITMPNEPSILFALSGSIGSQIDKSNADKLLPFVTRMPIEFQVVTLRYVIKRDKTMLANPAISKWVEVNGASLF